MNLLRFFKAHLGDIATALAACLYLALLAGREGLGGVFLPAVVVLGVLLAGLALYALWTRAGLLARLRADAPTLLLGAFLGLALLLRLLGRPETAPAPASDEAHFIEGVLGIINPQAYAPATLRHPTLLLFLELGTAIARFMAGVSANLWTWPTELVPAHLYGWGRGLVALLGAATLIPCYWLGHRLYNRRTALLAALFLSLVPMHVAAGGIVSPEVPAGLLVLLAVWCALRLWEEGTAGWALGAGTCAGLAAATHYPAALVLLVPLLALALRPAVSTPAARVPPRWALVLMVLAGALVAFLLACPAALLQTERFVAGLAEATRAYFPPEGWAGTALGYLWREGLGVGPAVLAVLGLLLLLPRFRRKESLLFLFPVALYLALLLPRARFARDLAMLAPWVALLAAYGVDRLSAWLEARVRRPAWLRRGIPWALALLAAGLFVLAQVTT